MEQNFIGPRKNWLTTEARELKFAAAMVAVGLFLGNAIVWGAWNLGYAIGQTVAIGLSWWYLYRSGHRGSGYTTAMLALCSLISAGFGWSADPVVKLISVPWLLTGINLALCQMAGQNRRSPGGLGSFADAVRTYFSFGFGQMSSACRGFVRFFKSGKDGAQNGSAFLAGLCIAAPILLLVIPLLISADAAFEGLLKLIPEPDMELVFSLGLGITAGLFFYTRAVALHRAEPEQSAEKVAGGIHVVTMNTTLGTVCAVYGVYLFSQLAYFVGGFSGILPEGFSPSEYARRGFFEMTMLCGVNLGLIAFGMGKVAQADRAPGSTRGLCLFLAAVSEFLTASGVAKMLLYIDRFGLTELRLITMVIMGYIAVVTALAAVWMFKPKFQYMQAAVLLGLSLCAGMLWLDSGTMVANYNVDAYLDGRLGSVDMGYFYELGPGAINALIRLDEADDPEYEQAVRERLEIQANGYWSDDIRLMNGISQYYIAKRDRLYPEFSLYDTLSDNLDELEAISQNILTTKTVTQTFPGFEIRYDATYEAVVFRQEAPSSDGKTYGFFYLDRKLSTPLTDKHQGKTYHAELSRRNFYTYWVEP